MENLLKSWGFNLLQVNRVLTYDQSLYQSPKFENTYWNQRHQASKICINVLDMVGQ